MKNLLVIDRMDQILESGIGIPRSTIQWVPSSGLLYTRRFGDSCSVLKTPLDDLPMRGRYLPLSSVLREYCSPPGFCVRHLRWSLKIIAPNTVLRFSAVSNLDAFFPQEVFLHGCVSGCTCFLNDRLSMQSAASIGC